MDFTGKHIVIFWLAGFITGAGAAFIISAQVWS